VARGWESKSIESQQADAIDQSQRPRAKLTGVQAAEARERENLRLSRQRVLQELKHVSNQHRRSSLEAALDELDQKLNRLGA